MLEWLLVAAVAAQGPIARPGAAAAPPQPAKQAEATSEFLEFLADWNEAEAALLDPPPADPQRPPATTEPAR